MTPPIDRKLRPVAVDGYPAAHAHDDGRDDVFDPALKHYSRAFVKGPPHSLEPAGQAALERDTSRALELLLRAIARSSFGDRVVVRGSVALKHWFGSEARSPKDLDLVVQPPTLNPWSSEGTALVAGLQAVAVEALRGRYDLFEPGISNDSIWTYERAEGRRIALPWLWQRTIRRSLQIDVVFAEPLCDGPKLETLDDTLAAWFATRAESLAWKLLWLETDMHPQGKDLYDALLLARHVTLSRALLRRVFAGSREIMWSAKYEEPSFVLDWLVDWDNFAKEYPALAGGGVEEQKRRLASTLVLSP